MRRWMIVILTVMVLGGCSRSEMLYRNADWLALRWAARLVDADAQQKDAWEATFAAAMERHQAQLLPRVVDLLWLLEQQAAEGFEAERLACWLDAAEGAWRAHAAMVVPLAVDVLASLGPQQVEHFAAELRERNDDYREEFLDPDPRRRADARVDRYVERIEHWTGDLSTGQLRLADAAIRALPDVAGDWLAYREQQQRLLLGLLRAAAGRNALHEQLTAWWVASADRPPVLVDNSRRLRRGIVELAVTLDRSVDDAQRARFVANIGDWRRGLEEAGRLAMPPDGMRQAQMQCVDRDAT